MALGEEYSGSLIVEVEGQELPEDVATQLVSGYVDDSRNVPDLFVLRFGDERATVLEKGGFRIGATVTLKVQTSAPTGPVTLHTGEVTALEAEVGPDGVHAVVRGLDASHRLFRGTRVEVYRNVTASDVARTVAQRAGMTVGTIDEFPTVLPHVAQAGTNDWDFLARLADEVGAVVGVDDGALDFRRPTSAASAPSGGSGAREDALTLENGVNVLSLRATVTSAGQVPEVEVRGWDVSTKREVVGTAPAATESADLEEADPAELADLFASPKHVHPCLAYSEQSQCDAAATALADRLAGGFVELDAVVRGNPMLHAGTAVALIGVGAVFDGRYTISAARHEFTGGEAYVTSLTVANASERSLFGVVSGAAARRTGMNGVLNATVTDIKDPDELGRVRVTFPVLSGSYESWWARTVQPGAGEARGAVVLPEIGDEVLVAFGQGSFDQPYVLGGLFNGRDAPDKAWGEHVGANDGTVTRRAFASRTGMVVEHVETSAEERLTVSTNEGRQRVSLVQRPDASIEIVSEGPLNVTAKKDVQVTTSSGDVTIKGANVAIEATSRLTLQGRSALEATGATVKVAGDASTEVTAAGSMTVRGAVVKIN